MSYIGKKFILKKQISYLLILCFIFSNLLTGMSSIHAAPNPQISKTSRDILVGKKYNLNINGKVKNSTYKWKSSNTSVATVNERGFVTGIKKGKAVITCTVTTPKKVYELTSKVTIRKPATSIIINNKIEEITVGTRYNLNKTIKPASSNDKTTWITSDAAIAKPDKNGIFTALKAGEVTITAKTLSGKTDKVTILVKLEDGIDTPTLSPTEIPGTPVPTQTPSIPSPTEIPDTPVPTQTPGVPIPTEIPSTPVPTQTPGVPIPTEIPDTPVPTQTPITPSPTGVPSTPIPTQVPNTPSPTEPVDRILSETDVVDGVVKVTNETYDIVTISNSVGDAEIIFENVTINDKLEMAQGAGYTVRVRDSKINNVVALEETSTRVLFFRNMAVENPSLIAEEGSLLITIDLKGTIFVKQEGNAEIGLIKINRTASGNIDVKLEGYNGNLIINTASLVDIAITTTNCKIQEASINGESDNQSISILSNDYNEGDSEIKTVKVNTGANVKLDVLAKDLIISTESREASVTIEKPIQNILSEGSNVNLNVKSNVDNIISKGDDLHMKISAGSAVGQVETEGSDASVEVALGSSISSIVSKGDSSEIKGQGTIEEVKIEGNNTKVDTPSTKVVVQDGVTGTTVGGGEVEGGTTNTTPVLTAIKIEDPGLIWSGDTIQMRADSNDLIWKVFENIDDTYGNASIHPETGLLNAYRPGTVRIVAESKYDKNIYGAVDVTINGKKFLGYEPLEPVIIASDEEIVGLTALRESGKLPETVNFLYESKDGTSIETVVVHLTTKRAWWCEYNYDGTETGNYLLCYNWGVELPEGYSLPEGNFGVYVSVEVRVPQTDNREVVVDIEKIAPVIISEDDHLIHGYHVFEQYILGKEVNVTLNSGKEVILKIDDWKSEYYDGGTPGTYTVVGVINLPKNMIHKKERFHSDYYVNWETNNEHLEHLNIPIQIELEKAQTRTEIVPSAWERNLPETTQPKFSSIEEKAVIHSITISDLPKELYVGEIINLDNYLTVDTNSNKISDKVVDWKINESYLRTAQTLFRLQQSGIYTIRAISTIDSTKFDEISIIVKPKGTIIDFLPLAKINISENLGINTFREFYEEWKDNLPNKAVAKVVTLDGEEDIISFSIRGWSSWNSEPDTFVLKPEIYYFGLYENPNYIFPTLNIHFSTVQTDNRMAVSTVTGSAITLNSLSNDAFATSERQLIENTRRLKDSIVVPIKLEDGTVTSFTCSGSELILNGHISYKDTGSWYNGEIGTVRFEATVPLPREYKNIDGGSSLTVIFERDVLVSQTLREGIWVKTMPQKMVYKQEEIIDLSGIIVSLISDTWGVYNDLSEDKLDENDIRVMIETKNSGFIPITQPLTLEMNGAYIYLSKDRIGEIFFGPIIVTE